MRQNKVSRRAIAVARAMVEVTAIQITMLRSRSKFLKLFLFDKSVQLVKQDDRMTVEESIESRVVAEGL